MNLLIILEIILLLPYLIFRKIIDNKQQRFRLYGIYGYFGLPGAGKTMAMSKYLLDMRKKYGNDIYIMTNYFFKDQDFEFTSWKDLLKTYDKPLIVAWDEIQNEFNSRDFKNFPISLLTHLTQIRKGNGVQIIYTSQRWHFVDKNFRTLSFNCYDCNTIMGSLTVVKRYDTYDYDDLCGKSDFDSRHKIKPEYVYSFIQTNKIRDSYDSYQMLESAKTKDYMSRQEVAQLNFSNFDF